jgi:hypothetical protein
VEKARITLRPRDNASTKSPSDRAPCCVPPQFLFIQIAQTIKDKINDYITGYGQAA